MTPVVFITGMVYHLERATGEAIASDTFCNLLIGGTEEKDECTNKPLSKA